MAKAIKVIVDREVVKRLKELFHRNGYLRLPNPDRQKKEGSAYRKGAEIRMVAESRSELAEIRRLLRRAGFKRVRPFAKGKQWRQPVYGAAQVARFLKLVGKPRKRRRT